MAAVLRVGFTPAGMQHDLEGVHPARASAERQDSHGAVRDRAQVQAWISQRFVRGQLVEGGPVHLREAHEQFHRDPALAGLEPGEGADRDTDQGRNLFQAQLPLLSKGPQSRPDGLGPGVLSD